jgi:hypothetical protein
MWWHIFVFLPLVLPFPYVLEITYCLTQEYLRDLTTLPIKPPEGLLWRSISVHQLHVDDETQPTLGLTYPKILGVHPFIRLPRQMSLDIIGEVGLEKITNSLTACEKLRRTALGRGDAKRVFTDYGKRLSYACVGPQP